MSLIYPVCENFFKELVLMLKFVGLANPPVPFYMYYSALTLRFNYSKKKDVTAFINTKRFYV